MLKFFIFILSNNIAAHLNIGYVSTEEERQTCIIDDCHRTKIMHIIQVQVDIKTVKALSKKKASGCSQ